MGGGAQGSAFGGIGVSNFTVLAAGTVLLAGLTAHLLMRKNARDGMHSKMMMDQAIMRRQMMSRRDKLHHTGHEPPRNYDEAANDLFAFTSSITLPDTALDNHDRIKECIHRHNPRIRAIMDAVRGGQMEECEGHQRIHGLSQLIMDDLKLPYRESINLMPYTISNIE